MRDCSDCAAAGVSGSPHVGEGVPVGASGSELPRCGLPGPGLAFPGSAGRSSGSAPGRRSETTPGKRNAQGSLGGRRVHLGLCPSAPCLDAPDEHHEIGLPDTQMRYRAGDPKVRSFILPTPGHGSLACLEGLKWALDWLAGSSERQRSFLLQRQV